MDLGVNSCKPNVTSCHYNLEKINSNSLDTKYGLCEILPQYEYMSYNDVELVVLSAPRPRPLTRPIINISWMFSCSSNSIEGNVLSFPCLWITGENLQSLHKCLIMSPGGKKKVGRFVFHYDFEKYGNKTILPGDRQGDESASYNLSWKSGSTIWTNSCQVESMNCKS